MYVEDALKGWNNMLHDNCQQLHYHFLLKRTIWKFHDSQFYFIITLAAACMVLSGPILTGYTQTLNDWEDRFFYDHSLCSCTFTTIQYLNWKKKKSLSWERILLKLCVNLSIIHEMNIFSCTLTNRAIDAINEPDRPIPSGAISENEVISYTAR